MLRRLRAEGWARSGARARTLARLDGSRALVLCYHRVLPRARAVRDAVEPGMFVTPDTFVRQLEWIAQELAVLPLGEITERIARGAVLPPRACAITFDDGWRDNHEHAWPALRAAGLPATIFLVTGRVGSTGAFWPDEVCRRLRPLPDRERRERVASLLGARPAGDPEAALVSHLKQLPEAQRERVLERLALLTEAPVDAGRELLSWDEVEEMARDRIDFESHGASHAILTGLPRARVLDELRLAQEALRERGLGRHELFAYPSGAFDEAVAESVRCSGHRAAFTTEPGLVAPERPPFILPRVLLHQDVSESRATMLRHVLGRAQRG